MEPLVKTTLITITEMIVDGEKFRHPDTIVMYHSGNCFLLEFPRLYKAPHPIPVNCWTDSVFNERLLAISYNYFAFDISGKYGYTYLELKGNRIKKIYVDSLLTTRWLSTSTLNKLIKKYTRNDSNQKPGDVMLFREQGFPPGKEAEIRDFFKRFKLEAGQ